MKVHLYTAVFFRVLYTDDNTPQTLYANKSAPKALLRDESTPK